MSKKISVAFVLYLMAFMFCSLSITAKDLVVVDFTAAEKTINWLKYVNTKPGVDNIKSYFMSEVAPTKGIQSIIHHWSRFKKWDNEELYKFITLALEIAPSSEKLSFKIPDYFEQTKIYWQQALADPEKLSADIKQLKQLQLEKNSLAAARANLPTKASIDVDFYFVLFGASTAFAVGKENGLDILQLPRLNNGQLNLDSIGRTIAHEMHHNGFSRSIKQSMPATIEKQNIGLIGVMAAEGMAFYYNQQPYKRFQNDQLLNQGIDKEINVWQNKVINIAELFSRANRDLMSNLKGQYDQNKIYSVWLSGYTGDAYIVGATMFKIIDEELGHTTAMEVATDYRKFVSLYNKAAETGNKKGQNNFIFSKELVDGLLNYY